MDFTKQIAFYKEHPKECTVREAADFIGCHPDVLREAMMVPNNAFGLGVQKPGATYRTFFVSTVKLLCWINSCTAFELAPMLGYHGVEVRR